MGFRQDAYQEYADKCGRGRTEGEDTGSAYFRRLVKRHFPADRLTSIVDLGCGDGKLLLEARRAGYGCLRGADIAIEEVEAAHRRGLGQVVQADILSYIETLGAQEIGVVLTMDVLEHLTKDEALQLARGVRRALAPGGRWIVHVPNGESPFFGNVRYGDLTHETAYTVSSLGQLCRIAGFARLSCFEDTPVVHGVSSFLRGLAWAGIREGIRFVRAVETGNSGAASVFSQGLLGVAECSV